MAEHMTLVPALGSQKLADICEFQARWGFSKALSQKAKNKQQQQKTRTLCDL